MNLNNLGSVEIKCQLDATDNFYCRSYCLLNMFQAPLCLSSGARDYYKDGCCLWYLMLWFSGCRCGAELRVVCPVCGLLPTARKPDNTAQHSIHTTAWNIFYHNTAEQITMYFYWLIQQNFIFNKVRYRLPEDGPGGPKHVGAIMRYFNCTF
jgi:hypothetical protein